VEARPGCELLGEKRDFVGVVQLTFSLAWLNTAVSIVTDNCF
jgi:hypothetical protein